MFKTRLAYLLLFICLCSCADMRPHNAVSNDGDVPPDLNITPLAVFPHPDGWDDPAIHGPVAVQIGTGQCISCHQGDGMPTCTSCHPRYPHSEGWAAKENHGTLVLEEGSSKCTTRCHGYDLGGGLSGVSCARCHEIYPHVAEFSDPVLHGEMAMGEGMRLCESCHGSDFHGGSSGVSCFGCHANYPHPADWENTEKHGAAVLGNGSAGCETLCHGADLGGGLSKISCNSCHSLYPHPAGWESNHGGATLQLGKDACKNCHGADFKAVPGGRNCFSCHADYPHPERALWLSYLGGHGERVSKAYLGSTAACERCHGSDLALSKNGENCFGCHPSYPHDKMAGGSWNEYEGHGQYALSHTITGCQDCHGGDYLGGISETGCKTASCHPSFPHDSSGWADGGVPGHASYVKASAEQRESCAMCHGNEDEFSGGHSGISCRGCHEDYRHTTPNWVLPGSQGVASNVHASAFIEKIGLGEADACMQCHGATYDKVMGDGRRSCLSCHAGGVTHGTKWENGAGHGAAYSATFNSASFGSSACSHCHGWTVIFEYNQTEEFLENQSDCYGCHSSYPHVGFRQYPPEDGAWPGDYMGWVRGSVAYDDLAHRGYVGGENSWCQAWGFTDASGNNSPQYPYGLCLASPATEICPPPEGLSWSAPPPEVCPPPRSAGGELPALAAIFNPFVEASCGGMEPGSCHYDGRRSEHTAFGGGARGRGLCAGYCHK